MPIANADIKYRLSGGASNSNPANSIGGAMSSTEAGGVQLFPNISSGDASTGINPGDYRCVYVYNSHATITLENAKVWIQTNTPSAATDVAIALDGNGLNADAEQATAGGRTPPTGETFTQPANEGAGISLGNIPPLGRYAVWIRRSCSASATSYANDGTTLRVKGDTVA